MPVDGEIHKGWNPSLNDNDEWKSFLLVVFLTSTTISASSVYLFGQYVFLSELLSILFVLTSATYITYKAAYFCGLFETNKETTTSTLSSVVLITLLPCTLLYIKSKYIIGSETNFYLAFSTVLAIILISALLLGVALPVSENSSGENYVPASPRPAITMLLGVVLSLDTLGSRHAFGFLEHVLPNQPVEILFWVRMSIIVAAVAEIFLNSLTRAQDIFGTFSSFISGYSDNTINKIKESISKFDNKIKVFSGLLETISILAIMTLSILAYAPAFCVSYFLSFLSSFAKFVARDRIVLLIMLSVAMFISLYYFSRIQDLIAYLGAEFHTGTGSAPIFSLIIGSMIVSLCQLLVISYIVEHPWPFALKTWTLVVGITTAIIWVVCLILHILAWLKFEFLRGFVSVGWFFDAMTLSILLFLLTAATITILKSRPKSSN